MLSTPFICCSSGVETDCSIVTASAPVYVVDVMICGGTIWGNCASGNPRIEIKPARTVMMAMTIATIGRRMKKFEIIGPQDCGMRNAECSPRPQQLSDDQRAINAQF